MVGVPVFRGCEPDDKCGKRLHVRVDGDIRTQPATANGQRASFDLRVFCRHRRRPGRFQQGFSIYAEVRDADGALMDHPARIGKYEIEQFLGGSMSHVYKARDAVLGREVALKLLSDSADADAKARFLQEARMASSINHE